MRTAETQVVVVGAGAAGLYTALCPSRQDAHVALVSATPLAQSSSHRPRRPGHALRPLRGGRLVHGTPRGDRLASNSLSECFVFGARTARAALAEPAGPAPATIRRAAGDPPSIAITAASRAALWRYGGLERSGDGLRTLAADPHPLVRLIAHSALAREESRGAHQRTDFPALDPRLDQMHVTLRRGREPLAAHWL